MTRNRADLPPTEERWTEDVDGHECIDPLGVAIVTVSTSREETTEPEPPDPSGDAIANILIEAGHVVTHRTTVPDDYARIKATVSDALGRPDVDALVTTGGTGVAVDDVTPDAVGDLFDRELPGFGEAFRWLSWEEVRTRIVSTRTTAGIARDAPVFVLPGSENAVRLATTELIVEEAPHLAGLAKRHVKSERNGMAGGRRTAEAQRNSSDVMTTDTEQSATIEAEELLPSEGIRQGVLAGEITQLHRGDEHAAEGNRFVIDGVVFEVTEVRRERLGDLDDADAKAEGSPNLEAYRRRIERTHDVEWDDDDTAVLHRFERLERPPG